MKLRRVAEHLFRREPGGQYYAVCSVANRPACKSLKTVNRRTAETLLPAALRELRGRAVMAGTFASVAEQWAKTVLAAQNLKPLSLLYRQSTLKRLLKDFLALSQKRINAITLADCQEWKARRIHAGCVQRFNNELGTLRMVFDYAISHGLAHDNPARQVRRERIDAIEKAIPTRHHFEQIVAELRRQTRTQDAANFVELLAYSGLRLHEAAELRWADVDFERGTMRVTGGERGTKNRRVRVLPLFPPLRALLSRTPRFQDRVLGSQSCRMSLHRACQRLGLPRFGHHSLRHFFCTTAIEAGISPRTLAQWIGHRDGGTLLLRTYAHVWPDAERAAADRMRYCAK